MSGTTKFFLVIISAILGGLVGAAIMSSAMTGNIGQMIDAKLAENPVQAIQTDAGPSESETTTVTESPPPLSDSISLLNTLDAGEIAVTNVYKSLSKSVVHISTVEYVRYFFQVVPQEGTGSGFIFNDNGYILTNNHVIEGAQKITVRTYDGQEYKADLVGTDPMTDIAVLHITDVIEIPPDWIAPLGDSDILQVGQRAIAIGNPFGFDSTVTVGVVSALNRPVTTEDVTYDSMIQTDASINPGNSGGPLINSAGQVIGINTVIYSRSGGSQGIGFAIPINSAKLIVDDLVTYGRVRRPAVGFHGITLSPALSQALRLSVNTGILVQEVDPDSGFGQAGLQGGRTLITLRDRFRQFNLYGDGDIIISLNGEKVTSMETFSNEIRRMELGEEVTLTIIRSGRQMDLTVTLTE